MSRGVGTREDANATRCHWVRPPPARGSRGRCDPGPPACRFDVWTDGGNSPTAAQTACQNALTGDKEVVIDAPDGLPTVATPLFDAATGKCAV